MKRIFPFLLLLTLLSGCMGAYSQTSGTGGKLRIITTIFPQYDFMRQIAGDHADLTMLLPPGTESHSYEPTPQDIVRIQNSDIFVYVGGMSDAWADKILSSLNTERMTVISLMDLVETVEEEHDHEEHDHDEEYDEHVWTSPKNAMIIVEALRDILCKLDEANTPAYRENAEVYLTELNKLDQRFAEIVSSGNRDTIIFGDRFPFRYFADAYSLHYHAAFPGCAPESEASAATVAFLIDKVLNEDIPAIFHIELSNGKIADTIREATGAEKLLFHSCHNLSKADFDAGETYLSLMNRNADHLETALR